MNLLLGLVLSCQLTTLKPVNYTAELQITSAQTARLQLNYQFYGAILPYKYDMTAQGDLLVGHDKRGDIAVVSDMRDLGNGKVTLQVDSKAEGSLSMICSQK